MRGPFPYIGGKNRIATQIIALFPEHTTYVEPFCGGAQVFFHKDPSPVEVLNDLDNEIVNFFRVCQHHYEELVRNLKFCLASRTWFSLFRASSAESLTDVLRAARFFYLQKNSFAGLRLRPAYHRVTTQPPSFDPVRLPELIENVHKRLAKVQIECAPYEEVIARFDRPHTLFFLDPPYWDRKLYRFNFSEADFVKMADLLGSIRGRFVLSLNDVPEVRKLFNKFQLIPIEFHYTAQRKAGKRYRELLITNYPVKRLPEARAA